MGISPDFSRLTPQEQNLIETGEIQNVPVILPVDVDGVLVSIWPALVDFWKKWKESPTLSPSQIWKKLEESIAQTRPPWWETLLPLARMAQAADQVIIWTNRVPVNQESMFWRIVGRIFNDTLTTVKVFDQFKIKIQENRVCVDKEEEGRCCEIAGAIFNNTRTVKASDQLIWKNRVRVDKEEAGRFGKIAGRMFNDINRFKPIRHKTWLERFPFFSKQAAERLEKAMPFVEKTQVLVGFPKDTSLIIQEIRKRDNPYVI